MEWFENVRRYIKLEPEQLVYSLLTRSQRVSHESLRLRDGGYLGGVERWFAARAGAQPHSRTAAQLDRGREGEARAVAPMFTPFTLRGMTVVNRVAVAPMDQYSA